MNADKSLDRFVESDVYPVELRVKALEMLALREGTSQTQAARDAAERRSSQLELLKIIINPTIAAALIAIVTLLITNNFTAGESDKARQNLIEIETLKAEIERLKVEVAASSTMQLEERKFQFDVVKAALSDSKESGERANALRFLSEIGILAGLSADGLDKWSNSQDLTLPSFESGTLGTGAVVQVPRLQLEPERMAALRAEAARTGTERWMQYAIDTWGVREAAGLDTSEDVLRFANDLGLDTFQSDDTPWSGLFTAWVLNRAGFGEFPASPLANRSWVNWGRRIPEPQFGALAIFWTGQRDGPTGQSGFVVEVTDETITLIAGNTNNQVGFSRMPRDRLLAVSMPE